MNNPSLDPFSQARSLINDLFPLRPMIYWVDFLLTMVAAWGSFGLVIATPWHAPLQKMTWLVISAFAFFRGLAFIHEIAHQRPADLPGFRWVWNGLCGLMFFLPTFTYLAHAYHHRISTFSTKDDLEYLPWAGRPVVEILLPFLIFPIVPFLMVARFLIVGPISLLVRGPLREWLLRHASTLKMNLRFEWRDISVPERRLAVWEETLCLGWWGLFLLVCYRIGGLHILLDWYIVIWLVLTINHLRGLGRHRYAYTGNKVNFEAQVLDSVTVAGFSPMAPLLMPVGLRYHSVHHMFPSLPYHALRQAHKRLQKSLPKNHLYFKTLVRNFSTALLNVFKPTHPVA